LPLAFGARTHAWVAMQGVLMFSVSYLFVYYAEQDVVSGLVAVGYSATPLLGMLGLRVLFRTPITGAMALGSVLGIAGIALVFWPELAHLTGDRRTVAGAIDIALAVGISTLGTFVAQRNAAAKLALWQTMAWGMLYGAIFSLAVALARGRPLGFEPTLPYVLSLAYLAVAGSILAFAGYLTLVERLGTARAGYVGVMVPIVALTVSAAFEGFRWHASTLFGIAISVAGNVIVLRTRATG
jgi:drug/metabolite transporter (DMT)-like permease